MYHEVLCLDLKRKSSFILLSPLLSFLPHHTLFLFPTLNVSHWNLVIYKVVSEPLYNRITYRPLFKIWIPWFQTNQMRIWKGGMKSSVGLGWFFCCCHLLVFTNSPGDYSWWTPRFRKHCIRAVALELEWTSEGSRELIKRLLGATPVSLEWGLGICISTQTPQCSWHFRSEDHTLVGNLLQVIGPRLLLYPVGHLSLVWVQVLN